MVRVLRERDDLARARELQAALKRNQEDLTELVNLFGANLHAAQKIGGSGIEGYFDLELRGSHGYSESIGLTERNAGPTAHWSQNPIDGEDLILTLDVDLQRVAQDVLERPLQLSDPKADPDWWQDPVGALVLTRVDGQVLAAASVPSRPQAEIGYAGQGRRSDDQRLLHRVQRTMRMPTFQPPGSTIKPLVALWAMEYGWLDEAGTRRLLDPSESLVTCLRESRSQASGYGKVRCSSTYGHSFTLHNQAPGSGRIPDLCLTDALPHSCNAFFSWLGQHLSSQDHRDLADRFGLGRPTGVRAFEGLGGGSPAPGGTGGGPPSPRIPGSHEPPKSCFPPVRGQWFGLHPGDALANGSGLCGNCHGELAHHGVCQSSPGCPHVAPTYAPWIQGQEPRGRARLDGASGVARIG